MAHAVPIYTMSCFQILTTLCKELGNLPCKFWWGSQTDARKIHWIDWEKLCWPKSIGGIGFRDLQAFNRRLLQCSRVNLAIPVYKFFPRYPNGNIFLALWNHKWTHILWPRGLPFLWHYFELPFTSSSRTVIFFNDIKIL